MLAAVCQGLPLRKAETMSTRTELLPLAVRSGTSAPAWGLNTLLGWVLALEAWLENRRQRRALVALSDRSLKDIGVSRSEAEGIAAMPFHASGTAAEPVSCRRDARSLRRE